MKITIPKPCTESWQAMTPNELGRFCNSCAKTVIDFTKMTDWEIVDFLKANPTNSCGKFNNDQLSRVLITPKHNAPNWFVSPFIKAAASILLLCKLSPAKAQEQLRFSKWDTIPKNRLDSTTKDAIDNAKTNLVADTISIGDNITISIVDINGIFLKHCKINNNSLGVYISDSTYSIANYKGNGPYSISLAGYETVVLPSLKNNDIIVLEKTKEVLDIKKIHYDKVVLPNIMFDSLTIYSGLNSMQTMGFVQTSEPKETININEIFDTAINHEAKAQPTDAIGNVLNHTAIDTNEFPNRPKEHPLPVGKRHFDPIIPIDFPKNAMKVFPNPATIQGQIHIAYNFSKEEDITIQIQSTQGSIIQQQQCKVIKGQQIVPLYLAQTITTGRYFIRLINSNRQTLATETLLVEQ